MRGFDKKSLEGTKVKVDFTEEEFDRLSKISDILHMSINDTILHLLNTKYESIKNDKKKMTRDNRIIIRMNDDELEDLDRLSSKTGKNRSVVIRDALKSHKNRLRKE